MVAIVGIMIFLKGNWFNSIGKKGGPVTPEKNAQSNVTKSAEDIKASIIGMGGGGALFVPMISPHDPNHMLVMTDMGDVYISGDKGENWSRKYLNGICVSAEYDPNNKNVLYVGGNGLYRSVDNGQTFEMIFPKKDDLIFKRTQNENALQYFMTKSEKYDFTKHVKSIVVDPDDSNHIFILLYNYGEGIIFESTDNGENFNELFKYEIEGNYNITHDFNKLAYKKESKTLYVINSECVFEYDLKTKQQQKIYTTTKEIYDAAVVYDKGKTYCIVIEEVDGLADSKTKVFYTNDFKEQVDITSKLTAAHPTSFQADGYGTVTYKYEFTYIAATSLDNIYITNFTEAESSNYGATIDSLIRYSDGKAKLIYGTPFTDKSTLKTKGWCDYRLYALGIAASKQKEDEFLVSTEVTVYFGDDTDIYARYSKRVSDDGKGHAEHVTSGIDVTANYKVCEDPFNENNMLILNTDMGLSKSTNKGKSWYRAGDGIEEIVYNNIYDAEYDKYEKDLIYGVWNASNHFFIYPDISPEREKGCFAISKDGGDSWDANYSSGIPDNALPSKMSVVYPENSKTPTIYVASYNTGFYVSEDGGKNFKEMNEGLPSRQNNGRNYILASDIEVADGHIYGFITSSRYGGELQPSELYEYVNGSWKLIKLPEYAQQIRDIYYKNGTLYVTGTATPRWGAKQGEMFTNYGGGIYAYKDGKFTQIFDEGLSTTSVQIDSKGTIYVSDIEGNIYRKPENGEFKKIYNNYHYISKNLVLTDDDDRLYLTTFGGGVLKLENLTSLK